MRKLNSISTIAAVVMLLATAGCIAPMSDETQDAVEKQQVVSRVESLLIDLTSDRDVREAVDAEEVIEAQDDSDAQVDVAAGPDSDVSIVHAPGRLVRIPDRQYLTGGEVHVFADQPEDHVAVEGEYYEQRFIATGGSGLFGWTCTVNGIDCADGPPGLYLEPSGTYQALIKGIPDAADVGELHYTIAAYDVGDSSENASVDFTLTVHPEGYDDPDPEDPSDPCAGPLVIEVIKNGGEDPTDSETPARLSTKREMRYEVTGGMGPYTWEWKSVVKDSHHCHEPQEVGYGFSAEKEIQERRYSFVPEGVEAEHVCHAHGSVDEWTRNPTWTHWTGESGEGDFEIDFTTWKSAETEGDTLTLKGKFIYDGPLPLDNDVIEKLKVRVKDSCSVRRGDQLSVTRKFEIEYPDDQGKKISGEVEYKDKISYGSGNFMKVRLYSGENPNEDDPDDDYIIAEARLDVDDLPECYNPLSSGSDDDICDEDLEFMWNEDIDDKGIDDVGLIRVNFGLGHKQVTNDCFWVGECGSHLYYGIMDVQEIEFGTTHWRLDYDDQDEGDDQMRTNDGPYNISEISGVKFKRREYPKKIFPSKWKVEDGGNDNDPNTPW